MRYTHRVPPTFTVFFCLLLPSVEKECYHRIVFMEPENFKICIRRVSYGKYY